MTRYLAHAGACILLAFLMLVVLPQNTWAKYEISNAQASVPVDVIPQQGPAADLRVQWDEVTMDAGESLIEYVYKWNNSGTALDGTQLNRTNGDGVVPGTLAPPFVTKAKGDFANDNFDTLWYLHVKTAYLNLTQGAGLSTDTVVGPFNFDNIAHTGTIALDTAVTGQTATTSTVNPVTLKLTATADTATVYLSNTTLRPATGVNYQSTLTHEVTSDLGQKTIYAWFKDQAGNIGTVTTLSFQLIAGKSIDPQGDLQMNTGATQTFTVLGKGATETFDWVFVTPNPADVATFSGASTDVASGVTVEAAKEGTFKVRATSKADSAVYTSGTITVVKSYTLGDVNDDTQIDAGDAILVLRYSVGLTILTSIQQSAGNVTKKANAADIDSGDAIKILRYSVGLIISFD